MNKFKNLKMVHKLTLILAVMALPLAFQVRVVGDLADHVMNFVDQLGVLGEGFLDRMRVELRLGTLDALDIALDILLEGLDFLNPAQDPSQSTSLGCGL